MKVAIAIWNGRISPVFDVARQLLMLDIGNGAVVARHEEALPGTDLQAQAARMAALGVEVLICGAISQPMSGLLAAGGMRVIPFIAGPTEEVLTAWLSGTLPNPALSMPGCCGQLRRCHGGRGSGQGRRGCGVQGPKRQTGKESG